MFFFGGVFGLALLVFWIWGIFDVITTDAERCRNLPKLAWALIVIILGSIGALIWVLLGRPERSSVGSGDLPRRPRARPVGLEDRPEWTAAPSTSPSSREHSEELDRRLAEWEAEERRRSSDGDDPETRPH